MNNTNIDIDITTMEQAVNKMNELMGYMSAFINVANNAADAAVASFGGTSTRVGAALQSKIVAVNQDDFKDAQKNLDTMLADIDTSKKTYANEEEDWLSVINKY